jgi:hypothetical protein
VVQARARWWRETAWAGLPTAMPSTAGVGREEQRGMWVAAQKWQGKNGKIGCRGSGGACAHEH